MKWGRKVLARNINGFLETYVDIQENKHLIGEAIMFVYIGVSDLSFSGPQSYSEKIFGVDFILPSREGKWTHDSPTSPPSSEISNL